MARTGRPPVDNPRIHAVPIRLSADELEALQLAADTAGERVGEYIRRAALAKARRAVRRNG